MALSETPKRKGRSIVKIVAAAVLLCTAVVIFRAAFPKDVQVRRIERQRMEERE